MLRYVVAVDIPSLCSAVVVLPAPKPNGVSLPSTDARASHAHEKALYITGMTEARMTILLL